MRHGKPRPSLAARETQERLRYVVLTWVLHEVGEDCEREVSLFALADELQVAREAVYAAVEYLARRGYLRYAGAGPRVCITPKGLEYVRHLSVRRRTVRNEDG